MPKVSIIVPVYNAEATLDKCVDSILSQDYQDFELILVDDGSSDGSAGLIRGYAGRDDRVVAVYKENTGVSDSRNRALSAASGEYVQFLDADDWITPEATGLLVRTAESSFADMVIADFYRVVGSRVAQRSSIDGEGLISLERYADCMAESPADFYFGAIWNKLYRRQLLEKHNIRMDPNLQWCEDFIFNLEYLSHAKTIYVLHEPIYYYVRTQGSLVSRELNLINIVRMKLSVFEYYQRFFRGIGADWDYARKKPAIYAYLFSFANDDLMIPGFSASLKLGEERSVPRMPPKEDDLWVLVYYAQKHLRAKLKQAAEKYDLDEKDATVLEYLRHFGRFENPRDLADSLGISRFGLFAIVEKLALRKLVELENGKLDGAVIAPAAHPLLEDLARAVSETEEDCTADLPRQDRQSLRTLIGRIMKRLRPQTE
ncbi:MAG: glycosyltransferase [Clostridia bacterium]|nr:glycosyltransferase [Clostridia bacterium]